MNIAQRLMNVRKLKKQFSEMSREDLEKHHEDRLKELLVYVQEHSPYYRKALRGIPEPTFDDLPPMDKAKMMENFVDVNTVGLTKEELFEFAMEKEKEGDLGLYKRHYSVGMSSGTSGNKGLSLLSKHEMAMYSCLLWARNGIPDSIRKKNVLFALRTNNPTFMEVKTFGLKMIYMDYTHPPAELVRLINREELNVIAGPPSLLSHIANISDGIDHPIDCVVSYAEILTNKVKKKLEDTFKCPVVQIYQCTEGFIASTCSAGNLHINEDIIKVKLEDTGDPAGRAKKVILYDLYRTTQPILNYSLNDVVEISKLQCPCGSSFRVISKIHGRSDDIFYLEGMDGEERLLFPDYVRRAIIQASDSIEEYQAVQRAKDDILIRLVLTEGAAKLEVEEAVKRNLTGRAAKVGGKLGKVEFVYEKPKVNPNSKKMIRVKRDF